MSAATSSNPDHWVVSMNRRNRTWCTFFNFVTVGTLLLERGQGTVIWILAGLQFLVYPQVIYLIARRARNPMRAEMNNVTLDAVCVGGWAAALGFPLWITFTFTLTSVLTTTAFKGWWGIAQTAAGMAAGALAAVMAGGFRFEPATGWAPTLLSMFTSLSYVTLVSYSAYIRTIKLSQTRAHLKRNEQELKRQLDEINSLQARLQEQATRDALTGLYNRRYCDETLERELARCRRNGQELSILMIDVDHFKQINDSYGHQAGDEVLRALAFLLNEQVRASDVACRYGGEEFLVLLPGAGPESALQRAEAWREAFSAVPIRFGPHEIRATLSTGIAAYPSHGAEPQTLLRAADMALYQAKADGRNRTSVTAWPG
ncbi:sensor domain-containing diguanylate cyclase [Noviherbaspirillum malthae]|uniref:sensor domain-containing diguanylate cyclase n=1 Tax=Noviherbaspirillum malthae TaxID=1260987 RepID=UPI00188EAF7D|nr:sensor domain-containing diguanylate cyclase [Noviherbaspirillum malthae]